MLPRDSLIAYLKNKGHYVPEDASAASAEFLRQVCAFEKVPLKVASVYHMSSRAVNFKFINAEEIHKAMIKDGIVSALVPDDFDNGKSRRLT